jgi:hypothetical protein
VTTHPTNQRPAPKTRGRRLAIFFSLALLVSPANVQALCGLDDAFREQLVSVEGPELARFKMSGISCGACHLGENGGPRNVYGNALDTLLEISDREDPARLREAGRRVAEILSDPSSASLTFGELIQQGRFPGERSVPEAAPLAEIPARIFKNLTVPQARDLVRKVESEFRFGILQLSDVQEISPEVAEVLAEFEGEFLILRIRSLPPAVAEALAKSRAANLWLPSVTSIFDGSAESISTVPGHLVMTGLTRLDSPALAKKLALRPGPLSFPYLEEISPEIGKVLATHDGTLTLGGLAAISPELQDALSEAAGTLDLPNLASLDSIALTRKLAPSFLVLPKIKMLSPEQAEIFTAANTRPASFWSGMILPLATITPEVAEVFANHPTSINLTLVGRGPIADETLETLLRSKVNLRLRDVEKLTFGQIRIVREVLAENGEKAGTLSISKLSLPGLKELDSALLAETFAESNGGAFQDITSISREAATVLGNFPDNVRTLRDGTEDVLLKTLSFPKLTELSPEIAQLLIKKRWASISLPSVQEISLETIRGMVRSTSRLTLGIPALPPEFAEACTEIGPGGGLVFPRLEELSPEAARILVNALNQGIQVNGQARISKSPVLQFGGLDGGLPGEFTLSPETAAELAKYDGPLSLHGLRELSDESARALSSFSGVYLSILGSAAYRLTPNAAAALAKTPATLKLPLRELDSVPLAERFAWQSNRSFYDLERISKEAIPSLVKYQQIFDVRKIAVLDSPELARRFLQNSWGPTLPALTSISPEAAEIVATSSRSTLLGLTVLDSPAVATALTKAPAGVKLPRLRAATSEVLSILKEATSIATPPLESVSVLAPDTGSPYSHRVPRRVSRMFPNLQLPTLLGLLTYSGVGLVAAAEQTSRAELVRELGDDAFDVRETATLRLANLGLAAKPELLAGIRGDDAEIRWRCERLWARVRDADFQQRAEAFLGDAEGLNDYEFPGWTLYRERFGASASARQLFLDLQKGEPALWEEFGFAPPDQRARFDRLCRQLQSALRRPNERAKITAASAASVLFMATSDGMTISGKDRGWADALWQVAAVVDLVRNDNAWGSLKREWFRLGGDGRPAFDRLMADLRAGQDSAVPVAREILRDPETPRTEKQYALLALTKSVSAEDEALIASFLNDSSPIDTYFSGGEVLESQVRDVALAASIFRSGKDPKEFGFRNLRRDPKTAFIVSSIGFVNAEERAEAFEKWSEVARGGAGGKGVMLRE